MTPCLQKNGQSEGLLFQVALEEVSRIDRLFQELSKDCKERKPEPRLLHEILGKEQGLPVLKELFERLSTDSCEQMPYKKLMMLTDQTMVLLFSLLAECHARKGNVTKKLTLLMDRCQKIFSKIIKELQSLIWRYREDETLLWHLLKHKERLSLWVDNDLIEALEKTLPGGVRSFIAEKFRSRGYDEVAKIVEERLTP